MNTFNVGDKVKVSTRVDLTDTPELSYVLGQLGTVTGSDNFGTPNNPLTMYDVALYESETVVPFYAEELLLIQKAST